MKMQRRVQISKRLVSATGGPGSAKPRRGGSAAALLCMITVGAGAGLGLVSLSPGVAAAATQRGTLFIGNVDADTITAYAAPAAGDATPSATISGTSSTIDDPYHLTPDANGGLWVANYGGNTVTEYTANQLAATGIPVPAVTLTSAAFSGPVGLTFDAAGDLWVSNYHANTLVMFTPNQITANGAPTPVVTISANGATSLDEPETSAFSSSGDLWVANAGANTLVAFTPTQLSATGSPTPAVTISSNASDSVDYPYALLFDPSGNLWVSNDDANTLVRFSAAQLATSASPTPTVTLSSDATGSIDEPWDLAFDGVGDLWLTNSEGPSTGGAGSVVQFSPQAISATGSPTPESTIAGSSTGLDSSSGLAFIPPSPNYLMFGSDGGAFAFGDTNYEGSLPALGVHVHNIVGVVPTEDGKGYLMIGSDGGTFAFGDAKFEGSLPGMGVKVNNIIGVVPTTDGLGYLMIGSDGGTFAFGDAKFEGSLPGMGVRVNNIIGVVPTSDGLGYLMIGSDGGTFAFGDAKFEGSLPGLGVKVNNIIGVVPSFDGAGYLMIGSDGGTFAFGDAKFAGSLPGMGIKVNDIVGAIST
jgi:streptogramin lyase